MTHSYRIYIDEAGDEGFLFHPDGTGSSRWFVLSAAIFRAKNDHLAVELMKKVRSTLGKEHRAELHFRKLKHEHRIPYVRAIGQTPMRTVSIVVNKQAIGEPERFQSEKFRLYRYLTRLLLERVSWLCRDHRIADEGDGTADVVFSNRGAMSYDDLRGYLRLLKDRAEGQDIRIDWNVINPDQVRAVNHEKMAGLQIADAVASGIYFGVSLNHYGEVEPRYIDLLEPTFYRNRGAVLGYGLKFWPHDWATQRKTLEHLAMFERFV